MPSKLAQLLTAIAEALAANGSALGVASITRPQDAEAPIVVVFGDGALVEIKAEHMVVAPDATTEGNAS